MRGRADRAGVDDIDVRASIDEGPRDLGVPVIDREPNGRDASAVGVYESGILVVEL
jgi:hypothetical protein